MKPFLNKEKPDKILLENLKIPKNLVLGKLAELFLANYLKTTSTYRLLAHNLQLIVEKQTLGEFDFFIEHQLEQTKIHLELVYKFYVYDPTFEEEIDRWIGPNRKDSLVKKITRLTKHQLPLLYKKEAREMLVEHSIESEKFQQQVCFKANLFVPKLLLQQKFSLINNQCICGYWLHQEEFSAKEYGHFQFFSPKKPNWPVEPKFNSIWKSFEEIQQEINYLLANRKAALVWMKKSVQEYERFFVVWW